MEVNVYDLANEIYTTLGPWYSERVYHNAMEVILREKGIHYESERIIPIVFKGHVIGNLRADIVINRSTILEFKTIKNLNESTEMQAHNYMNLTGLDTAYLINFPPTLNTKVEIKKIVTKECSLD